MLPQGGSFEGWEQLTEAAQVFEAELIALRLRESGVEARVLDQSFKQEPLPNIRSFSVVRVLVPAEQVALAREILARPVDLPDTATDTGEE